MIYLIARAERWTAPAAAPCPKGGGSAGPCRSSLLGAALAAVFQRVPLLHGGHRRPACPAARSCARRHYLPLAAIQSNPSHPVVHPVLHHHPLHTKLSPPNSPPSLLPAPSLLVLCLFGPRRIALVRLWFCSRRSFHTRRRTLACCTPSPLSLQLQARRPPEPPPPPHDLLLTLARPSDAQCTLDLLRSRPPRRLDLLLLPSVSAASSLLSPALGQQPPQQPPGPLTPASASPLAACPPIHFFSGWITCVIYSFVFVTPQSQVGSLQSSLNTGPADHPTSARGMSRSSFS